MSRTIVRTINQLFSEEKNLGSVESRKALLDDFTSKVYSSEVEYIGIDGKTIDESNIMRFHLVENQKDDTLTRINGLAVIFPNEGNSIRCVLNGVYIPNKKGYKMRVLNDTLEMDFYLYCECNDNISFLIKKSSDIVSRSISNTNWGSGYLTTMDSSHEANCIENCKSNCAGTWDWTELTDPGSYATCNIACMKECR